MIFLNIILLVHFYENQLLKLILERKNHSKKRKTKVTNSDKRNQRWLKDRLHLFKVIVSHFEYFFETFINRTGRYFFMSADDLTVFSLEANRNFVYIFLLNKAG